MVNESILFDAVKGCDTSTWKYLPETEKKQVLVAALMLRDLTQRAFQVRGLATALATQIDLEPGSHASTRHSQAILSFVDTGIMALLKVSSPLCYFPD